MCEEEAVIPQESQEDGGNGVNVGRARGGGVGNGIKGRKEGMESTPVRKECSEVRFPEGWARRRVRRQVRRQVRG